MQRYCPFCKLKIKLNGGNHIYGCNKELSKKEIRFLYIKYNFPELTKNKTKELYIDKLNSLPDIQKKYNIDFKSIQFLLDYYSIPRRGISEGQKKSGIPKAKKTNLKKYGAENALSRGTKPYKKKNKTVKEKYGVKNVFQVDEIKEKIFGDGLYIEKYNLTRKDFLSKKSKEMWQRLTDEQKTSWLNKSIHKDGVVAKKIIGYSVSKLETKIQEVLNELHILYEPQFCIKVSNKKRRFYDFLLKNTNLLMEVQGDYWHCNPNLYCENDIVFYKFGKKLAKDIWEKDAEKKEIAGNRGYKVIELWENDINNIDTNENLKKFIVTKIKEFLNENYEN